MTKQKRAGKLKTGHKVSIGAFSVFGLIAGWNIIGRAEQEASSAAELPPATTATIAPAAPTKPAAIIPLATPWPTIAPLVDVPRLDVEPLPTLVAVAIDVQPLAAAGAPAVAGVSALPNLAPMPTLAPLPTMPEYVAPPPPPPVQVAAAPPPPPADNGGGNSSGGS
jgi:hypothetical protein